jgi:putative transcriptional regulator
MNLVGKCLIARPVIQDPFFKRGVVYIYEQTPNGVAGVVVNKRKGSLTTDQVLRSRGYEPSYQPPEQVYSGGPVNENAFLLLHTSGWTSSNTMQVNKKISVTSDDLMIYKYLSGDMPKGYRWISGVSVWHPKQIQVELQMNNWLVTTLRPHFLFDYDGRDQWDKAIELSAKQMIDRYI